MDLLTFFLGQHAAVHASDVSGRVFPSERVFAELTDDQMRLRPGRGVNSLVWILWHIARTEDAAVNLVVGGRDQVLDEEWMVGMNVPWRIIGTGMTDDEVTAMTARADVAAVRAYRSAVGRRTREVVQGLRVEAWDAGPSTTGGDGVTTATCAHGGREDVARRARRVGRRPRRRVRAAAAPAARRVAPGATCAGRRRAPRA